MASDSVSPSTGRGRVRQPWASGHGGSVVERAAREGQRAARRGMFDEWSFQPGTPVPYLEYLLEELAQRLREQDERATAAVQHATREAIRGRGRREDADDRAARAVGDAEQMLAERRAYADHTLDQLDLMSGVHLPPVTPPASVPVLHGGPASDVLASEAMSPPGEDPAVHDPGLTAGRDIPVGRQADGDDAGNRQHSATAWSPDDGPRRPARDRTARAAARWMGPDDGRLPLAVPLRWRRILLALLMLIEIPIYYEVFRGFHPTNATLRAVFTGSVALCMVVAPHMAGTLIRHRHERPYERTAPYVAGVLLTAWACAAVYLGVLRQAFVFRPVTDVETGLTVRPLGGLGLSQITVTMTFLLILVMSGLIALALGLAEEHPGQRAFRYARRRVQAAEQERQRAYQERAAARQTGWEAQAAEPDPTTAEAPFRQRSETLVAEYATAAAAYLNAVAQEMSTPPVTQSIGLYLRHLREEDLPPAPADSGPVLNLTDPATSTTPGVRHTT